MFNRLLQKLGFIGEKQEKTGVVLFTHSNELSNLKLIVDEDLKEMTIYIKGVEIASTDELKDMLEIIDGVV